MKAGTITLPLVRQNVPARRLPQSGRPDPHRSEPDCHLRAVRVNRPYLVLAALFLTSCATNVTHQFAAPTSDWQTRNGQLLYRTPKATVIGEAFVRFSNAGDFELTFSKGPVTLFVLRQDQKFADVKGPLAGRGWSGAVNQAPQQLRGWLELRDEIVRAKGRRQVRHVSGEETFLFRF